MRRHAAFGRLARHLRFADRMSRKLARKVFHGMVVYRGGLERKQAFLFRTVDIAVELFAMTATISRACHLRESGAHEGEDAEALADLFVRGARRKVRALFRDLWRNDDARLYATGRHVLEGRHLWLEGRVPSLPYDIEDLRPPRMNDILAEPGEGGRRPSVDTQEPPELPSLPGPV